MAAKCMYGPGSSEDFARVEHAALDEVLFTGLERDAPAIDDQGIASLDDDHIFIEAVGMRGGCG
jgi:hypothetical protein